MTRLCNCGPAVAFTHDSSARRRTRVLLPTPDCLVALKPFTFIQLTFHSSKLYISVWVLASKVYFWVSIWEPQLLYCGMKPLLLNSDKKQLILSFYFSQVVVFLLLLFMLQMIVILNVFAKHCTCSCEWCVWYFIVFV